MTYLADITDSYISANSVGLADIATFGAESGPVFVNRPDLVTLSSNAKSTEYQARLKSALFPTIARGASIAIGGDTYIVRNVEYIQDGSEKIIALSRVIA